jgi:hypothetical protein
MNEPTHLGDPGQAPEYSRMPIDYRIIVPAGIVHATFRGRISVSDIEAYRSRLRIDAEFSPEMDSLADFNEVSTLEPVGSEMATIVMTRSARVHATLPSPQRQLYSECSGCTR